MVSRLVWSGSQPTSISSDGRIASYSKDGNLFIHEIATGVDRNLTTWAKGASGVVQASVISRDGKHVVYRRAMPVERRSELWLANLEGDPNPRRLLGDPDVLWVGPYDWSPDNKWFAAALERKDGSSHIGLVSIPDGNLRVLKSVDGHRAHPRAKQCSTCDPHFSPDGKYLGYDLYENETGNERDVFVISIDGTHEVPVVVRPGNDEMLGWSPDGKWLLFTSDRTGSTDLWAVAFANGKTQDPPRWLKEDFGTKSWSVGLTSSGALYYLTNSGSGRFRLWSLENFLPKATAASR
jgi:dipeptidyl aminopeptidase/acylaminoacyl peptidase